jgi:Tfp pilus assembly protein PilV
MHAHVLVSARLMPRHQDRESGVSLVDVLMSMFLLSIALVGFALAFPPAYLAVFQERTVTHAVTIAEQRVELARRQAITPTGPNSYATLQTDLAGTTTVGPYTVTTTITPDAPATNFTTVSVNVVGPPIVGPNTPDLGPQSVTLETFVAAP